MGLSWVECCWKLSKISMGVTGWMEVNRKWSGITMRVFRVECPVDWRSIVSGLGLVCSGLSGNQPEVV